MVYCVYLHCYNSIINLIAMDLNKLYHQIMGTTKSGSKDDDNTCEHGFYSLYDKSDYETRTYSSFNNINI